MQYVIMDREVTLAVGPFADKQSACRHVESLHEINSNLDIVVVAMIPPAMDEE